MTSPTPLSSRPNERRVLQLSLVCGLVLLLLGVFLPLMTVAQFWLFENQFSLLSGLWLMLQEGRWLLALLIFGFSLLLPLLKITVLIQVLRQSAKEGPASTALLRTLHWMHLYGKWSMLDVFVVAVLLASIKLGAIAQVQIHSGLYAFAAAVLLTMLVTARVTYLTQEPSKRTDSTAAER
ncbi:MAG: paraquat-inducible protein A [Halopseudomonas sp.]